MPAPYKFDWEYTNYKLKITSELPCDILSAHALDMLKQFGSLRSTYDIGKVKLNLHGNPLDFLFKYETERTDGRLFKQTMKLVDWNDANPLVTFDVPVGWKASEFGGIQVARLAVIKMINSYHCTEIEMISI